MNNHFHPFATRSELHQTLAQEIATLLQEAIDDKNFALFAVSGGSTPKPLFEQLSQTPLEWDKVIVTLVDERWVDNTHAESNEKLVKEHLLQNLAKEAKFLPLKSDAATPFECLNTCNRAFKAFQRPFDVIVLGMGTDGHTASFFPNDLNLHRALTTTEFCAATVPTDAPHERMTLSLHTILKAQHLFLHIEGDAKKTVYDEALSDPTVEAMPVRAVLHHPKPLEVYHAQ